MPSRRSTKQRKILQDGSIWLLCQMTKLMKAQAIPLPGREVPMWAIRIAGSWKGMGDEYPP